MRPRACRVERFGYQGPPRCRQRARRPRSLEVGREDRRQEQKAEHDPHAWPRSSSLRALPAPSGRQARARWVSADRARPARRRPRAAAESSTQHPRAEAAQRRQAAGDQDRARGGAGPERSDPSRVAQSHDRRERLHRHDQSGRQRLDAPAVDEQDHEQEERCHERARNEEQGGVRCEVRPPDRVPRGHGPDAAEDEQRDEGGRRLDEEDRLPAERLREDAARGRPERGSSTPASAQTRAAGASAPITLESRASAARTTAAPATP